jgi:hypothetical protein
MRYLTFMRHSESHRATPPPPALMEAMGAFIEKTRKEGSLIDTGGLLPSKDGLRIRLANGEQGGHWRLGDSGGGLEGEGDRGRHGVHGAASEALARLRGRVGGARHVRAGHGAVGTLGYTLSEDERALLIAELRRGPMVAEIKRGVAYARRSRRLCSNVAPIDLLGDAPRIAAFGVHGQRQALHQFDDLNCLDPRGTDQLGWV